MSSREQFEAWYLTRFGQCDLDSAWAMERWEAWQASRVDIGLASSESGHAVPQWLRDHFSAIEDEAMKTNGCAVFTQMRTKVQAYFEMHRADLAYAVALSEAKRLKAENEVLRKERDKLAADNRALLEDPGSAL